MKLGIVGLPNVGKSTLFNAITNAGAESANYPFCTIEPNVGMVTVPDERLDALAKMYDPDKYTPAVIEFVDIAGLVKGASKGEGLGNKLDQSATLKPLTWSLFSPISIFWKEKLTGQPNWPKGIKNIFRKWNFLKNSKSLWKKENLHVLIPLRMKKKKCSSTPRCSPTNL